jgi:hypothetical protein
MVGCRLGVAVSCRAGRSREGLRSAVRSWIPSVPGRGRRLKRYSESEAILRYLLSAERSNQHS